MTRSAEAGKPGRFIGAGIPMKTNRILVAGRGTYIADIDIPGYGRGFFFGASGAGGASRLRAFRCHVLRADRRAHLGEQPLRLAQLALASR